MVRRRVATGAMSPVVAHPLVQGWCRGIWGADGRGLRAAGDAPGDAQRRGRPPACLLASRRSHMGAGASGQRRPEDARAGDLAGNVHRGRAGQGRGRSDQPEPDGRERAGQAGPDGGGTGPAVRPGRRDWFGVRGALKREPVYATRLWPRVAGRGGPDPRARAQGRRRNHVSGRARGAPEDRRRQDRRPRRGLFGQDGR